MVLNTSGYTFRALMNEEFKRKKKEGKQLKPEGRKNAEKGSRPNGRLRCRVQCR